jgi:two-component system cell cycle response regulator DivK
VDELVLIVDDDERNARLVRDVLERAGMRVLTAATAADGLILARSRRPDIVVLDLRLPDLDGTEAMRRLAADVQTAAIPVVALSAIRSEDAAWGDAGFVGYVEKPIDVATFPAELRVHLTPG